MICGLPQGSTFLNFLTPRPGGVGAFKKKNIVFFEIFLPEQTLIAPML